MPYEPQIKVLPYRRRVQMFWVLLLIFLIGFPSLVFYASGNRISFLAEEPNVVSVGGVYISADADTVEMFVDDELVTDMRLFQQAAYIDDLPAGIHRIHTQASDLATWVKTVPVHRYIVTRVDSFNMPLRPQIRVVPEWNNAAGSGVVFEAATTTFSFATTTNAASLVVATSTATSTLVANPEYTFLAQRFASSTEQKTLLAEATKREAERFQFPSERPTTTASLIVATTTKIRDDIELHEADGEVYARYIGREDRIPEYFCMRYDGKASTTTAYGEHVVADIEATYPKITARIRTFGGVETLCRDEIRIDRKWQSVQYFDFVPGLRGLVLLQLQDGVYVVEIDDRAWQNVQMLYPGDYLDVLVINNQIFIKDGENIVEVFTALQQ